jgi:hypothetical protein
MDTNKQNIKSVKNINEYIEKIFFSFYSLYKIFMNFHVELCNFQNDLSFRSMSEQLLDSYNRLVLFLFEQIKGILSISFITDNTKEVLVIKPVYNTKYFQDIEITYFTEDTFATKPLGNMPCISLNKINDEIIFLRGNRKFTFITFDDNSEITINEMYEHIEIYIKMIKDIINWLHTDIKSIKISIKTLINVVSEIKNMSSKKDIASWIEIVENIKKTMDEIDNI